MTQTTLLASKSSQAHKYLVRTMYSEKMQVDEADLLHQCHDLKYKHKHPSCTSWHYSLLISFMILLATWNVYLTLQQWTLANDISILRNKHDQLEAVCSSDVTLETESDSLLGSLDDVITSYGPGRTSSRIDTENILDTDAFSKLVVTEQDPRTNLVETALLDKKSRVKRSDRSRVRRTRSKDVQKRKSKKNKQVSGAHFVAYVDEDKVQREIAEGLPSSVGNFTDNGLQPKGRIYNFWKPEPWSNTHLFLYNKTSGKVKVKKSGLYLIYGQMMFHSPSARKSYGIHINDEVMPFIESLSFDNIHQGKRSRRSATPYDPDPYTSDATGQPDVDSGPVSRRHKRAGYSSYSQCNTLAVRYLHKNDEVFLKSLEFARTVIPRGYLTFWGMARL